MRFCMFEKLGINIETSNDISLLDNTRYSMLNPDKKLLEEYVSNYENFDFNGNFIANIKGTKFKCLYIDNVNMNLYVSLMGARSAEQIHKDPTNKRPKWSRWTYSSLVNAAYICIDDPMYFIYPDIRIGWFYGDKNKSYITDLVLLINQIQSKKNIPNNGVVFISSSAGGFSSIYASAFIKGSLSISFNPQLYIQDYPYAPNFQKITGINLIEHDCLDRNNPAKFLKEHPDSKHVIIINIKSKIDLNDAIRLANEFKIKLRYGLTQYKNVLFWLYEAEPRADNNCHVCFENKQLFKLVEYISKGFSHFDFDINRYQQLCLYINEIWYHSYTLYRKLSYVDSELSYYYDPSDAGVYRIHDYINNIYLAPSDNKYNHYRYDTCKLMSRNLVFSILGLKTDSDKISYGLYDFSSKCFLEKLVHVVKDKNTITYICKTHQQCSSSKIGFVIYAGEHSKSNGHFLYIENFLVYKRIIEK